LKIGACTIPTHGLAQQLGWIADNGFDYAEVGWEAVQRYPDLGSTEVKHALERFEAAPVGHTTAYLPSAFPVEDIRAAASRELERQCALLADVGAERVVVHPWATVPPYLEPEPILEALSRTLSELEATAEQIGVILMVENMGGRLFGQPEILGGVLDAHPEVRFVLDTGHAREHAGPHGIESFVRRLGSRLSHVHAHDVGEGGGDPHSGIGEGIIDWATAVQALRGAGFDGTVTIEVFEGGKEAILASRDRFKEYWNR
jgi:sugar phosphate isomerase/epimerase